MSKPTGHINIVIADDHAIFRDGLRLMLSNNEDISVVAEAAHGQELLSLVETLRPQIVITDIKMPYMDGIEATHILHKKYPEIGVIALSMFDEDDLIMEMLEAGALGYLLKNADKEEVIEAVKTVYWNDHYYCRQTSHKLAQLIAKRRFHPLKQSSKIEFSEREIEIIQLICQEFTNKEIAERLFMSVRTVEGYRLRILEKMEVKNSIGLVIYAIQHDIYSPTNINNDQKGMG